MVFASRRRCYRCHAPCAAAGGAAAGPTARDLNDRGRGRAKFGLWCGRLLAALGPAPGGGAAAVEAWLEDVPVQTKHFQTKYIWATRRWPPPPAPPASDPTALPQIKS
jgi:hypothetical protein